MGDRQNEWQQLTWAFSLDELYREGAFWTIAVSHFQCQSINSKVNRSLTYSSLTEMHFTHLFKVNQHNYSNHQCPEKRIVPLHKIKKVYRNHLEILEYACFTGHT